MRKPANRMNGKQLAEILPIIHDMVNKGVNHYEIAHKFKLSYSTVYKYHLAYQQYLNGKTEQRIQRAVPYLHVQQAKMKFTEERKRQPAEQVRPNEPKYKRNKIELLWGCIKINW